MELTNKDTKMIQAISALAMVCLHLFCTLEYNGLFTPLVYFKDIPLIFYFAQLSDFCVAGFAFCSGYAHMVKHEQKGYYKNRLLKLFYLLINFWIVLIAFSLISIAIGQSSSIPGSLATFLGNFFLYRLTYNGAWWYLFTYAIIVIISPIILKIVKKFNPILVLTIGLVLYCVAYYVRVKIHSNWLAMQFGLFGMTLFEYEVGAVFYRHSFFTKLGQIKAYIDKKSSLIVPILSLIIFLSMLLGHTLIIRSLIIAPATGCIIIIIFKINHKPEFVQKILLFIGKHSTNIWLTHMFFYLCVFKDLVYCAKYPLMIFLLMLVICLAVSVPINLLHSKIVKIIDKKFKHGNT
ncbi:MAG: acyltransferase [Clostridia bacterium]|nr:acyltransferase [Clostridia bacterium]